MVVHRVPIAIFYVAAKGVEAAIYLVGAILMMLLWIPLKLGGCLDAAWKKNDAASPEYLEIKLDPSAPIDRRKDGITLCEGTYKKRRVKTDKDGGQNERLCDHNVWDKVSGVTGRVPRCLFFMDKGDSEKGWYIAQTVQKDGGKDLEYFARTPVTAGGESSPVDAEREGNKAGDPLIWLRREVRRFLRSTLCCPVTPHSPCPPFVFAPPRRSGTCIRVSRRSSSRQRCW
jgi:hypothetical protein